VLIAAFSKSFGVKSRQGVELSKSKTEALPNVLRQVGELEGIDDLLKQAADWATTAMLGLADMFEGWAQDSRLDLIDMARLLGRADGLRSLVAEVGADYVPPEPPPDARPSLLKFMARQMFR
jgi:hypothetical protein